MYNNQKENIMEKFGLVDKTKEELIDIVLNQETKEKQLSKELEEVNAKLAHAEGALKRSSKSICSLCVMCMLFMISVMVLLFNR